VLPRGGAGRGWYLGLGATTPAGDCVIATLARFDSAFNYAPHDVLSLCAEIGERAESRVRGGGALTRVLFKYSWARNAVLRLLSRLYSSVAERR